MSLCLQSTCGTAIDFPVERWYDEPTAEERALLDGLDGPVLDVGCGPGRHVLALNRRGIVALGIDASPTAVALACRRGATAIERSVFGRVPAAGRWGAALLLDGNVGIGGDPLVLFTCVAHLLRAGGTLAVEIEGPGFDAVSLVARLDDGEAQTPWFPWARLGVDGLDAVAAGAGLTVDRVWDGGGRWFASMST
jgi:SAM-dependent methyltransferase